MPALLLRSLSTYVVSSLLSTISTRSKNQPALAWLLSCRILSFFRTPRSTAVMSKKSSWVTREQARRQGVKKCHRSTAGGSWEPHHLFIWSLFNPRGSLDPTFVWQAQGYPVNSIIDNDLGRVEHKRLDKSHVSLYHLDCVQFRGISGSWTADVVDWPAV